MSVDFRDEPRPPYTHAAVVEWIQYRVRIGGQPPLPTHVAEARAGKWIQDRRREYRRRALLAQRADELFKAEMARPIEKLPPREAVDRVALQVKRMPYRQKRDLVQFFLNKQELTEEEQHVLQVLKDNLGADWARPFNAPPAATVVYGGLPGLGHRHS